MFLGRYDFAGDPDELLGAYRRMMGALPPESIYWHACVRTDEGISVLDACPTREVFREFSTSDAFEQVRSAVGLPDPVVTEVGEVVRTAGAGLP
jgi:hypothetical protein